MLLPLRQRKSSFKRAVSGLEIPHHGVAQAKPTMGSSYTLGLIPGERTVFQQRHSNLSPLNVVIQPNKVEICVQLMDKPAHAHPIHRALKVVGQTRLDR